ncbi:hypothetical protein [Paenarthrobacter aurescens]|uniref:UbiC transcription regulator-associated domain-containing protein n=1 Tax=Paenarthrobacter aurescens (strain TC1) TaxID=290340 RepID=A1R881_PAEAT|nr:hypothetical protein [Paenarthrobacter aurescens]ABM10258.1 hypothetical protein AAur_2728 [Paenarthrobacter aurescens TC1]
MSKSASSTVAPVVAGAPAPMAGLDPPEHLADALNVRGFAMVPRLERTTLGPHGEVLECTVTYFHPKGFEIRAEVATDVSPGQDPSVPSQG